jgi:PAS domain S-box-containing protein
MLQTDDHWFEDFFNAIYQFTGILDPRGNVIKANRATLKLTGLSQDQIYGQPLWRVSWPALSRQNRQTLKHAVKQATQGISTRNQLQISKRGYSETIIELSFKPIFDEAGGLQIIIAEGRDVTVLKQTSQALFQSEARFKTIFEKAGIGILIKGVDGKIVDCNPAFQAMLGYSTADLLQRNYLEITHPIDRSSSRKLFNDLVNGKRSSYNLEKRYLSKAGEVVWCRVTVSAVDGPEDRVQYAIAMVENITAQKQFEAELMEMKKHIMLGREAERLRLAQDLHDGPLQEIIGISYQVGALKSALTDEADREQLLSAQTALQQLTKSVRLICGELRPPTLIPFGLEKAILSHVEQSKNTYPELNIELDLNDNGQSLSEPLRIVLFRVYQEAYNNVIRHAQAANMWVRFWLTDEQAILEVQDDGMGFVLPKRWISLARQGHLGLVGTMERIEEFGGTLEINTAPGKGTQVRAIVPLKGEINRDLAIGEEE